MRPFFHRLSLAAVMLFASCAAPVFGAIVFQDNFDSYANGQDLHGVNGWKGWDNLAAASALVSNTVSSSTPNSVAIAPASDLVHQFSVPSSGIYNFSIDTFVPTGSTGQQWFILLNTYNDGGPYNWSLQQVFDNNSGLIGNADNHGVATPIIYNQWVPLNVVIDLGANTQSLSYGGTPLFSGVSWTEAVGSGGGALAIGAVDLFGNGASTIFYDNLSLTSVPEPGPLSLLGLCVGGILVRRRKYRS